MAEEQKIKTSDIRQVSRREFLKDAGLLVGGATVGSMAFVSACGGTATTTHPVVTTTVTVSKFICPNSGCGQEFSSLAELQAHIVAEHPNEAVPEKLTKLTVNGIAYELKVEPNWTLAEVLRDKLGMTGTKISCDKGECGFCTVVLDGEAVFSCLLLAATCEGKSIQTIEGLSDPVTHELHPIQEAFKVHHGMQCGFCTPGAIMTTKALLDKNPNPTVNEAKEALSGIMCRCSNFPRILESVMAAAAK